MYGILKLKDILYVWSLENLKYQFMKLDLDFFAPVDMF